MKLQRTTEYALRTLAFMCAAPGQAYSSSQLHRELGIPKKYLQRLLTRLARSGVVRSRRGRTGGYVLTRGPGNVSLLEIVETIEGFDRAPQCFFGFGECPLENPCAFHDRWVKEHRSLLRTLSRTRLSDLLPRPQR